MHATHPEMAARWEKHTPKGKKLPERAARRRRRARRAVAAAYGDRYRVRQLRHRGGEASAEPETVGVPPHYKVKARRGVVPVIDVARLKLETEKNPLVERPLSDFLHKINKDPKTGYSEERVARAHPDTPIILSPHDDVLDGRHRIVKRLEQHANHVMCKVATLRQLNRCVVHRPGRPGPDDDPARHAYMAQDKSISMALKSNTITKNDVLKSLASATGITQGRAAMALDHVLNMIVYHLNDGKRVEFRNFGVFEAVNRQPKITTNPQNGVETLSHQRAIVRFRPGKNVRRLWSMSFKSNLNGAEWEKHVKIQKEPGKLIAYIEDPNDEDRMAMAHSEFGQKPGSKILTPIRIAVAEEQRNKGMMSAIMNRLRTLGYSIGPNETPHTSAGHGFRVSRGLDKRKKEDSSHFWYSFGVERKVVLHFPSQVAAEAFVRWVLKQESPPCDLDWHRKVNGIWTVQCDAVNDEATVRRAALRFLGSTGRDMSMDTATQPQAPPQQPHSEISQSRNPPHGTRQEPSERKLRLYFEQLEDAEDAQKFLENQGCTVARQDKKRRMLVRGPMKAVNYAILKYRGSPVKAMSHAFALNGADATYDFKVMFNYPTWAKAAFTAVRNQHGITPTMIGNGFILSGMTHEQANEIVHHTIMEAVDPKDKKHVDHVPIMYKTSGPIIPMPGSFSPKSQSKYQQKDVSAKGAAVMYAIDFGSAVVAKKALQAARDAGIVDANTDQYGHMTAGLSAVLAKVFESIVQHYHGRQLRKVRVAAREARNARQLMPSGPGTNQETGPQHPLHDIYDVAANATKPPTGWDAIQSHPGFRPETPADRAKKTKEARKAARQATKSKPKGKGASYAFGISMPAAKFVGKAVLHFAGKVAALAAIEHLASKGFKAMVHAKGDHEGEHEVHVQHAHPPQHVYAIARHHGAHAIRWEEERHPRDEHGEWRHLSFDDVEYFDACEFGMISGGKVAISVAKGVAGHVVRRALQLGLTAGLAAAGVATGVGTAILVFGVSSYASYKIVQGLARAFKGKPAPVPKGPITRITHANEVNRVIEDDHAQDYHQDRARETARREHEARGVPQHAVEPRYDSEGPQVRRGPGRPPGSGARPGGGHGGWNESQHPRDSHGEWRAASFSAGTAIAKGAGTAVAVKFGSGIVARTAMRMLIALGLTATLAVPAAGVAVGAAGAGTVLVVYGVTSALMGKLRSVFSKLGGKVQATGNVAEQMAERDRSHDAYYSFAEFCGAECDGPKPKVVSRRHPKLAVGLAKKKKRYPWNKCVADAQRRYGSVKAARRVCGKIRAGRGASYEMDMGASALAGAVTIQFMSMPAAAAAVAGLVGMGVVATLAAQGTYVVAKKMTKAGMRLVRKLGGRVVSSAPARETPQPSAN